LFRGYSAEGLVTNGEGWVFVLSKDEGEVFWLFGAPFTPLSDTDEPVTLTSYGRFDISMMSLGERTKVMADSVTRRGVKATSQRRVALAP
jgi:hypothetical protein